MKTAQSLAQALGTTPEIFFDNTVVLPPRPIESLLEELKGRLVECEVVDVPLRGCVPCGNLSSEEEISDVVTIPRELLNGRTGVYALRVQGQSLSGDAIYDQDYVLVDPSETRIIDGKIFAVRVDHEVAARHVTRHNNAVRLSSSHGDYEDIVLDRIEILGRIIASYRYQKLQ
jgi:repressor LexA